MANLPKDKMKQGNLPFEKIQKFFYEWQGTLIKIAAHDFYRKKIEFTILFYVVHFLILAVVTSCMRTIIFREIFMKLEAFAYLSLVLEVSIKSIVLIYLILSILITLLTALRKNILGSTSFDFQRFGSTFG